MDSVIEPNATGHWYRPLEVKLNGIAHGLGSLASALWALVPGRDCTAAVEGNRVSISLCAAGFKSLSVFRRFFFFLCTPLPERSAI